MSMFASHPQIPAIVFFFFLTGDQGDFDVFLIQPHSALAPTVLYCCTCSHIWCNLLTCTHLWDLELFISVPFVGWYGTVCLYVLLTCPLLIDYIVHMQMAWSLCFRMCCLFCTWWLICTPTSPALLIHRVVIWWRNSTSIIFAYTQHANGAMQSGTHVLGGVSPLL